MTLTYFHRCRAALAHPRGDVYADIVAAWATRHATHVPEDHAGTPTVRAVLLMPPPHGLLAAGGFWRSFFAIPLPKGAQVYGGLRLNTIRPLWGHLNDRDVANAVTGTPQDQGDEFNAEELQHLVDHLQESFAMAPLGSSLREALLHHACWIQIMRNSLAHKQTLLLNTAYDMELLIHTVMGSGLLRGAKKMKQLSEHCLNIVVDDPALRRHLLGVLTQPHAVPSRTTLYRHRLTFHLGWRHMLQALSEERHGREGGIVTWRTLDLSPQAGVEWSLHGCSTMRQCDLPHALTLPIILCGHPEDADVHSELNSLLRMEAGIPVGVGSGRKSLKHKGHGLLHTTTLTSRTWRSAARLLNTSVTVTGGLGKVRRPSIAQMPGTCSGRGLSAKIVESLVRAWRQISMLMPSTLPMLTVFSMLMPRSGSQGRRHISRPKRMITWWI